MRVEIRRPACYDPRMGRPFVSSVSGRLVLVGLFGCLTAAAGGCQRSIVPVSGRVTLNGQPLAEAVVTFQPHAERNTRYPIATGSVGHTDSQGRYSLRLIEPDRPGAAVGEHSVTISTSVGGSDAVPPAGKPLPPAWRDGSRTFRVPANGTSEANFEIKISEPAKKKRK